MSDKKPTLSEQLFEMKKTMKAKCPMALDEVIGSFARCEMIYANTDDKIEKYFAREAMNVMHDMATQFTGLATHPNLQQIVESAPDGL